MRTKELKSKLLNLLILPLVLIILFEGVVGTPVQLMLDSNVDFHGGVLDTAFDLFLILFHFLFYWICFSAIAFTRGKKWIPIGIAGLATIFRYPLNLLSSLIVIPAGEDDVFWIDSLLILGIEIGMDLLQFAIVTMITFFLSKKVDYQKQNVIPLLSAIPVGLEILMRILYDLFIGISGWSDVVWMLLYYGFDVLCFFIGMLFLKKWKTLWEKERGSDGKDA